jgi:hypothetical protein
MGVNPALADAVPLVGFWRMELHHADFLPDPDTKVAGSMHIDWIENGSALVMRQGDSEHPPTAIWIVGRDDSGPDYRVLYSDERGVSRIYNMSLADGRWKMWRTTPDFSQRFEAEIDPEGQTIRGRWMKSFDSGASWEHDFNIDYLRI